MRVMSRLFVGLVVCLAACSDTAVQFRVGTCDQSWDSTFNGQHPEYCEKACHKFVPLQAPSCTARTSQGNEVSCALTFAWDGTGQLSQPLADPLIGCCIKGSDTSDDPAEQFAVCED